MGNHFRAKSHSRHSREGGNPATFAFNLLAARAKSLGPRLRGDDGLGFMSFAEIHP